MSEQRHTETVTIPLADEAKAKAIAKETACTFHGEGHYGITFNVEARDDGRWQVLVSASEVQALDAAIGHLMDVARAHVVPDAVVQLDPEAEARGKLHEIWHGHGADGMPDDLAAFLADAEGIDITSMTQVEMLPVDADDPLTPTPEGGAVRRFDFGSGPFDLIVWPAEARH